jgi:methylmalonyl-CoA/ethylmalonyl-CoA epimerase|tara:strand:+ start:6375 stop:6773 length:399 start_codon:yes stop_codon:yes gene_type:complete
MKLHHIGIVVPKIHDSIGELTKFLKFETIGIPTLIGSQKVNVCFMKLGDINLELIEPVEKNSPVSSFLSDGGGFHHLCFEVKDINEKISELEKSGARLLIKPVLGFEERQIAFLYLNMKNTNFNLIELATEK